MPQKPEFSHSYKIDNLHILLWLLKDLSWLMSWKLLGIFMILPTFCAAIFITQKTRKEAQDFFHNLAMTFWIVANSAWMLCEFFDFEEMKIFAAIPFFIGLALICFYWLGAIFLRNNHTKF
jgi:hypothetical protein